MGSPRLSVLEAAALAAFSSRAREALGHRLVRVVLFGSRARGEGRDDSDLDLLTEVQGFERADRRLLVDLACDVGLEHHLVLSPMVVEAGSLRATPLGAQIEADGVAL